MKTTLRLLALIAFFTVSLSFTACNDESDIIKPSKEANNGDEEIDPDRMD